MSQARTLYQTSVLLPLLEQEAIALYSRTLHLPVLHFWRHDRALLLGSRDVTLPQVEQAIMGLAHQKVRVAVRPFGGLAVALDSGVVNISLVLPDPPSLDHTFLLFSEWLREVCSDYGNVTIGEVEGAYCPGRFDLAIDDVKFAGIAQRRIQDVAIVSAFVNVVDAGMRREELVSMFYRTAVAHNQLSPAFIPVLERGKVGNLHKEVQSSVEASVHHWVTHIINHMGSQGLRVFPCPETPLEYYRQAYQRLIGRLHLEEWTTD